MSPDAMKAERGYHKPTIEDIFPIMDRIVTFDKIINSIKEEEE